MFPPLLLALLLTDYFPFTAATPPIYFNCSITEGFYSGNTSRFHSNLHQLLFDVLYINGKWSGYSNASVGDNPDKVYGSYLCRGDIRLYWCRNFMYEAIKNVFNLCPNYKGAVIWYDECFLQYSSTPLSDIQKEPTFCMPDPEYAPDSKGFDGFAKRTLGTNIRDMNVYWDAKMYTSFAVYENGAPRAFSMVQCEPNILGRHCLNCLNSAAESVFQCSAGRQGGRFFTPRCNLRYSSQSFLAQYTYVIGEGPIESPSGNETFTHHSKKHNAGTKFSLGASMVASLLIMSLASYVCYRRRIQEDVKGKECWDIKCHKLTGDQFGCDLGSDNLHDQNLEKQPVFSFIPFGSYPSSYKKFSEENKLGKGGFGEVYKGTLQDGMEIAVKRLSTSSSQGVEELKNEVTLIAKLQHRNLVKLLGCCLEENESLLIYEYMPNKSLDFFLFDSTKGEQLDWTKRLIIIKGIARGILYLHEDSRHRIVHRDLKASNVLLDLEMNPKISDFGLARIFSGNQSEDNTKRVVGTFGYMAPEYATQGLFSMKSDVFSFGVLLLEIISGKKTSSFHDCGSGHSLISNAWKLWSEGQGLELMDLVRDRSCVGEEVLRCINIGLLCVQYHPADRPNMSYVVFMLASDSVTVPQPMVPTFIAAPPITILPYDAEGVSINTVTITELSPR